MLEQNKNIIVCHQGLHQQRGSCSHNFQSSFFSKEFADKEVPVKTFGCQPTRKLSLPIGGDDNCALMITQSRQS